MIRSRGALAAVASTVTLLIAGGPIAGCGATPATARAGPVPLAVAGYLVPWDPRSRATAGGGALTEVSPVWFEPNDDGGIGYASDDARASVPAVVGDVSAQQLTLAPSISNFRDGEWDGGLVARLIADPARRSAHVSAIVDLVRSMRWPAVDLDYESLPAASRTAYSAFVAELAVGLHRLPARLSVTVHAKTSEPGDWSGARAQDWHAIGAAADEVRVMAYDYSDPGSGAGPIAPTTWVDQVLSLATRLIPRERVVLGLPTYGYDWSGGTAGDSLQWTDVQRLAKLKSAVPGWDARANSPWLRYTDQKGQVHTVWYEDARSLAAKVELARHYGLSHVVLWRLGGEDPGIWSTLRSGR
jgi:spore germination protein YaaH